MLTSTPTEFTQSSTTASKVLLNLPDSRHVDTDPTPIDLDQFLPTLPMGLGKRRAIDTAPRIDTSSSGNSCDANQKLNTQMHPLQNTDTRVNFKSTVAPPSFSATTASVSRLAVPLPIAIKSTLCSRHKRASSSIAPALSSLGANG